MPILPDALFQHAAANPETPWLFYAEGLRWIGSIFHGAAEWLEHNPAADAPLDPRAYRDIDEYVNEVRMRAHLNG